MWRPETLAPPALIIIDLQKDFVALSPLIQECVMNVRTLLTFYRENNWPVFHVIREYRADLSNVENVRRERYAKGTPMVIEGTPGQEIVDELTPLPNETVIIKPRFSAFFQTDLDHRLKQLGVENIVVSGTVTQNCVRSTVYDGVSLDYWVTVVRECVSAQEQDVQDTNLRDMQNLGVTVTTMEEYIGRNKE